jgi:hypothetical protein
MAHHGAGSAGLRIWICRQPDVLLGDFCWLLLVVVGCCWLLLVVVGGY